jgi:hypothetical protein
VEVKYAGNLQTNLCSVEEHCLVGCNAMKLGEIPMLWKLPPGSAGYLPGLLVDLKDKGDMFLRNVRLPLNYMVVQPRRPYCCGNLKSSTYCVV